MNDLRRWVAHPQTTNAPQVFRLLVWYRWLSLIPTMLQLATGGRDDGLRLALGTAVALNVVITAGAGPLNAALLRRPWLLVVDLSLCGGLIWLSGGRDTAFYLYSFSPILAAAFFFQWRGALLSAAGMAAWFILSGLGARQAGLSVTSLVLYLVGYFLLAGTFGYATTLLAALSETHAELDRTHRDLAVIHNLTLHLQTAADVNEVQEHVLNVVTGELGYPRAIVALVNADERVITAWLSKSRADQDGLHCDLPHTTRLALAPESGEIARSLLEGQSRLAPFVAGMALASDEPLRTCLGATPYHLFPMLLREHPVGVLLVDASGGGDPARLRSLHAIAGQAAVAVGTTMLCIDRAQRLAIQEERIRFARDIHDTVSQSLFGLRYSLDACLKLLPENAHAVRGELAQLRDLAEATRVEVRQSILDIWPSELTAERFADDLRRHLADACRAGQLALSVEVHGDFSRLAPSTKRGLYRVAQEALNNVVRHAHAAEAGVCLDITGGQAALVVRDNGRGFDPARATACEFDREHFGLRGIQDRAASLGGRCEILSRPGAGTSLLVTIPAEKDR